jgi:hypothetical protein
MGRPIKKSFFGNLNVPPIGGEGVSSTIVVASTGTGYSQGSVAVFSAPQLPDGVTATGTLTIGNTTLQGRISAVTLVNGGSGYTSTATVSVTTASSVSRVSAGTGTETTIYVATASIFVGMGVSGTGVGVGSLVQSVGTGLVTVTVANASTVTGTLLFADYGSGFAAVTSLTASTTNALAVTAYLSTGSSAVLSDIVKQEASRRYLVRNAQGVGQCKLVTAAPGAGEMTVAATDANGSTYYVKKLTAYKAVLIQDTVNGSFEFANNAVAGWTLGAASTGTVTIASN